MEPTTKSPTTIAGYLLMIMAWSVIGFHAYDCTRNNKEANLPLVFVSMLFAGLGAGLPIQDLDISRFLGKK